ncbi:hypothetical protein M1D49_14375 [Bacillus sp. PK3-056]|jgi:hypothetical protein|uniref:hypothetical protein n=1 Tax=Niallia circulans TaxID=1397 RepID=UPI001F2F7EC8|nr:hypothetical protein [Niallia circulans]
MKRIIVPTVFILGVIGILVLFLPREGFDIEIENQANKDISGLYLTYENIKKDIEIPTIMAGEKEEFQVSVKDNSSDNFEEAALKLVYEDNEGNQQTEYIIGYFEKGYYGEAKINILSVDEKGKLEIEVTENTKLF